MSNYPTAENPGVVLKGDEKKVRNSQSVDFFRSVVRKVERKPTHFQVVFFFKSYDTYLFLMAKLVRLLLGMIF